MAMTKSAVTRQLTDRALQFVGTGFVKLAELGGDGQDTSFEQSFSNLAHAYLRDKAPTLLDHELGFQLVDRNQENTKAIGVFAFKVGSQRLFAPVFFLKGDLKGHELLYMRNQDMFVPLKENWLNYILNRKPNILGTGVDRNTSRLGVRPPDLNRLTQSPYKFASAIDPDIAPFMPLYGHLGTQDFGAAVQDFATHCQERLDLGHFLKQASLPALDSVVRLFQQKPAIAQAFDRWHGMSVLSDAIKEAKARLDVHSVLDDPYAAVNRNQPRFTRGSILEKSAADDDNGPDAKQKIKIITWDQSQVDGLPDDITEEDQEKLLADHLLIKDERKGDEVSVPMQVDVEQRLSNPTETGIYQVLVKMHGFEKCLVVIDPHGPDGRKNLALVVRLDESARNWGNFSGNAVWVSGQDESLLPGGEESWDKWFDSLPDTSSLSESSEGRYMVIGPRRNASCPFRVKREIGESLGTKSYEVDFSDDFSQFRGHHPVSSLSDANLYDRWYDGQRVHIDAKDGTEMRSHQGDLFVPKGYKVLKLEPTRADDEERKAKDSDGPVACCGGPGWDTQSDPPPIQPGNLIDATMHIMQKTASLRIDHDGLGYSINHGKSLRENPAIIHLVRDHGLTEDMSRHLLKQASVLHHRGQAFTCRVKYASPFLTDGGPSAPSYNDEMMFGGYNPMGFNGQTQQSYGMDMPIPEMSSANTDPSVYNVNPNNMQEPMDVAGVNQAMQTGQREVFDTAMIGSMLKAVRDDTMIDRYLPDLIKGVDRLGRILFMFYWHQDKFADRYGKQDMPELEDSLRNAFEMMGDVVLFLKQKTVEPYPEEDVRDIDLGQTANN